MSVLLYTLCAVLLVLTGAVISGGLRLPRRTRASDAPQAAVPDALERELAAMLQYGREEEQSDEI